MFEKLGMFEKKNIREKECWGKGIFEKKKEGRLLVLFLPEGMFGVPDNTGNDNITIAK
jgi:hypothetical protein